MSHLDEADIAVIIPSSYLIAADTLVRRLARVVLADTDSVALIRLVQDARWVLAVAKEEGQS